jgi:hypothetical protein
MRSAAITALATLAVCQFARAEWWDEWQYEGAMYDHHNWFAVVDANGRQGVHRSHPESQAVPFKWKRTVTVGTGTSNLHVEVSSDATNEIKDFLFKVVVNGQVLVEEVLVGATWHTYDVSLAAYAGQTVNIELWNADSGNWWYELAYWDNVYLSGTTGGGTTPPPDNYLPLAMAGPDQILEDADGSGSETVSLDGSGSSDSDGTIVSYVWKEGGVELATSATAQISLSVGRHYVTLTVTDDDGATRTDTTIIDVVANYPPVADAGPDQTVRDDNLDDVARVTLDGSGSYDTSATGSIASHVWTESGTQIATGATPQVDLDVGTWTITLTVTDNRGDQATDSVRVTVQFQDDDADGMADAWEIENFSDLSETAAGDPDEDGAANIAEFATGTDPNDPLSFPVRLSGGGCAPGRNGAPALGAALLSALLVLGAGRAGPHRAAQRCRR